MTIKTNKQKCLEMWEWLAENPQKNKNDYYRHLTALNKKYEFEKCWACKVDINRDKKNRCNFCPITFPGDRGFLSCLNYSSPWKEWTIQHNECSSQNRDFDKVKKAALGMIKLIKDTWKEKP